MPVKRVLRAWRLRGLDAGPARWQRISGSWATPGSVDGVLRVARTRGPAENMILLAGAEAGAGFQSTLRILESSGETAGGAIVFVDFLSPRDYLAFHFCPGKQLVECFARIGTHWRRMGLPVYYPVEIGKPHRVEVILEGPIRRLRVDGRDLMSLKGRAGAGRFGLGSKLCPVEFAETKLLGKASESRSRSVVGV